MEQNEKKPLIILTGPTAVGKTELSIGLAKAVQGEIISADSMQVYKKMDVGTAKITKEQMQGIPHHLLDILEPTQNFNVMEFQRLCKQAIQEIYSRGHIPIIVGGTGFYIQSILYDIDFEENDSDYSYREELEQQAKEKGPLFLHDQLKTVDPDSAEQIHPNNVKRVIRALEYYKQTGKPISQHNQLQRQKQSPYHFRYYVLRLPSDVLYQRINDRVDLMRENGLVDEVRMLLEDGLNQSHSAMQALGYKEIVEAFQGNTSIEEAFYKIKQETRHFAKRQFTWFRRERDVTWIDKDKFRNEQQLLDYLLCDLKEQKLIQ